MIIEQTYIDRIKNKDEEAFEYIYTKTKNAVYSVIFAIMKSHVISEDIMQEVYMKMLASIHQYQENTNFLNWLLQIAHHHSIDYYRKHKLTVSLNSEENHHTIFSKEPRPDELDSFTQMMDLLNEDERLIVLLKVVEEMRHREIAKLLDKPLGTVLWIYQNAMRKLRRVRGNDDEEI